MGILGRTIKTLSVGCASALVLMPTAAQAAMPVRQPTTDEVLAELMTGADPVLSRAEPSASGVGWLTDPPFDVPADALVVNSPGTDDTTLYKRIDPMRGDLRTVNVVYPESLWPIISGKSGHLLPIFAPTYDRSVAIAVDHNLETMAGLGDASDKPYVVYTGYSQGADALGDAAVLAHTDTLLDPATDEIVLISDPRSPWGLMQFAADHPLAGLVFCLVGAKPDGARNPADTGADLAVTSVIIDGDPGANFQWVWYRPIASLIVNAAGFLAVHTALGPQSYADLDEIDDVETLYSRDGRTTYLIYHADHPLTQVAEVALRVVGIQLSDGQVDRLNTINDAFYPLQQPSPQRAAPAAPVTPTPPAWSLAGDEPAVAPDPRDPGAAGEVRDVAAEPRAHDTDGSDDEVRTDEGGAEGEGVDEGSVEAGADDESVEGGADDEIVHGDAENGGADSPADAAQGDEPADADEPTDADGDAQPAGSPAPQRGQRRAPSGVDASAA